MTDLSELVREDFLSDGELIYFHCTPIKKRVFVEVAKTVEVDQLHRPIYVFSYPSRKDPKHPLHQGSKVRDSRPSSIIRKV